MKNVILILAAVGLVSLVVAIACEPRNRCRREHGFEPPIDARHIACGGDAWHGFGDRGAVVVFDTSREGRGRLEQQLHAITTRPAVQKEFLVSWSTTSDSVWGDEVWCIPSNRQYEIAWLPRGRMRPIELLRCESSTGNGLCVEVWERPDGSYSVRAFTDWN